jgi:hypothetical protein
MRQEPMQAGLISGRRLSLGAHEVHAMKTITIDTPDLMTSFGGATDNELYQVHCQCGIVYSVEQFDDQIPTRRESRMNSGLARSVRSRIARDIFRRVVQSGIR